MLSFIQNVFIYFIELLSFYFLSLNFKKRRFKLHISLGVSLFLFSQGGSDNVFSGIICAVCAVLNIGSVYDDYTFLNQIKNRPAGIVDRYESMPDFWFAFLWSVTKGMGVGLIAWIFTMLTRSFVLDNRQSFLELENNVKN